MTKIDFKVPFLHANGTPIQSGGKETLLSDQLSDQLAIKSGTIKARKAYGWSKALARGEPLVLDDSDKKDLTTWIDENPDFFNAFKCQLLDAIDAGKEEK